MANKEAFTTEIMIDALRRTKGMVYLAAEVLGCHHQTVYNYIAKHPTVKAAFDAESGKILDIGEMKLYEAVLKGDPWGVQFLLKTKGKQRGYVERTEQQQELLGKDGGPLAIEVQLTSAKEHLSTKLAAMAARNEAARERGPATNGHGTTVSR